MADRTGKTGLASLNKRAMPKRPTWDLGLVPSPDNPEKFQEFGRNAKIYYDRIDGREIQQEYLLARLMECLNVPHGEYKVGLLRCIAGRSGRRG
jgi:hypothetical protein